MSADPTLPADMAAALRSAHYTLGRVLTRAEQAGLLREDDRPHLTARQCEVLTMVASGKTNATIARELFLSVHTVKDHLYKIQRELGARNRVAAVAAAVRLELI